MSEEQQKISAYTWQIMGNGIRRMRVLDGFLYQAAYEFQPMEMYEGTNKTPTMKGAIQFNWTLPPVFAPDSISHGYIGALKQEAEHERAKNATLVRERDLAENLARTLSNAMERARGDWHSSRGRVVDDDDENRVLDASTGRLVDPQLADQSAPRPVSLLHRLHAAATVAVSILRGA